jgi:hypothetical protein
MAEILTPEQIEQMRGDALKGAQGGIAHLAVDALCDSNAELREEKERLEKALQAQEDLVTHLRGCPECSESFKPCRTGAAMVKRADEMRRAALAALEKHDG